MNIIKTENINIVINSTTDTEICIHSYYGNKLYYILKRGDLIKFVKRVYYSNLGGDYDSEIIRVGKQGTFEPEEVFKFIEGHFLSKLH